MRGRNHQSFNSRSREGSDGRRAHHPIYPPRFNSRSREGSDRVCAPSSRRRYSFNSRSREGSDYCTCDCANACHSFQFALPRGERPASVIAAPRSRWFQFALPRGERLSGYLGLLPKSPSFNSRSREGSDNHLIARLDTVQAFQFALPRGERRARRQRRQDERQVSIRAPARGATGLVLGGSATLVVSIRAPARGATRWRRHRATSMPTFQFALPRGERRPVVFSTRRQYRFNSRSREGSDLILSAVWSCIPWFQFALPRGERQQQLLTALTAIKFQFALPRGERPGERALAFSRVKFQFALPRGKRPPSSCQGAQKCRFQFALPRGERPITSSTACGWYGCFNSRSREGSDRSLQLIDWRP